MASVLLSSFGFVFTLLFLLHLSRGRQIRNAVLKQHRLPVKSTNGAATPPGSTLLGKEKTSQPAYHELFPPHRREALADLQSDALEGAGRSAMELSQLPPDHSKLVPDKACSNTDDLLHHTTATGFTVEEIRRLGDFPDYATLSGIPLPKAYHDFNIDTALSRPYRPFRWPYHQTMCKSKIKHALNAVY